MNRDHSEQPLSVEIQDGRLVIEIGVRTLTEAFLRSPVAEGICETDDGEWDNTRCVVTDEHLFAQEVRRALCDEAEDGSDSITRLLDKAFEQLMDSGPMSVWWWELGERDGEPCPGGLRRSDDDRELVRVEASESEGPE